MAGYHNYGISSNALVSPTTGLCPDFDYFMDLGVNFYNLYKMSDNEDDFYLRLFQGRNDNDMDKIKICLDYLVKGAPRKR